MSNNAATGVAVEATPQGRIGKELLPSTAKERDISVVGYFAMWVGMAVIIATYALGGEGVQKISLPYVVLAVLAANVFIGIFITLSGDIGVEHGIPFPIFLRVTFGMMGSNIPSLMRGIIACCWLGIQSYYGATAISFIVNYFTGFDNWFVCFIVFMILQVWNAAMGIEAIDKFALFAAPAIILISLWMIGRIYGLGMEQNIDIWRSVMGPGKVLFTTAGFSFQAFIMVCFTNMSYWSTNTADTQSLTKYIKAPLGERNWLKRNINCIIPHMVALPLTQTFCILIGGITMLVMKDWNPIVALQGTTSGIALVFMLLLIALAQWSTNTATSILPPAMIFMSIFETVFKKHMGFKTACVITGILATVMQPWLIMENFPGFLGVMGSTYGPICGVFLCDYYVLRRRRLNLPDVYKLDGQYSYDKGWNIPGMICLLVGIILGQIFQVYAWMIGTAVGFCLYYVMCKFWYFKKHKQREIEENYDDKYLGISANHIWEIDATTAR